MSHYPVEMNIIPKVSAFFDEATNTISYIIKDPNSAACAIIDSVMDIDYAAGRITHDHADKMIEFIHNNDLMLEWIIETHVHADHLSAAPYIQDKLGGKIGIGQKIMVIQDTFGKIFNEGTDFQRDGSQFDRLFEDGDTYKIGTVKNICASDVSRCIVIVRSDVEKYNSMLCDFNVDIVCALDAHKGMSASMRAGVDAAGKNTNGYMICLGDMPSLTPRHFNEVIVRHGQGRIIRPRTKDGHFGHPVLFDQCFYDDLKKMSGDEGARALIKREIANVRELEMDDAILIDLDTPAAWENLKR